MNKTALIIIVVLIIGVAGYFFYRSQYPSVSPMQTSGVNVPANSVIIKSNTFTPETLNAKVGDKITWTNSDSYAHTITSDDGTFDSGKINAGGTFSFTFTKAGTYNYHCAIHTFMTAKVVVTN